MGKSRSRSTAITTTTVNTTNNAYDQRTAAADSAIAIGAGAQNITIDQTPEEAFTGLFNLTDQLLAELEMSKAQTLENQTAIADSAQANIANINKYLLIGLGVLVAIIIYKRAK